MPTARSVSWVELLHAGSVTASKQGTATTRRDEPLLTTVAGDVHERSGSVESLASLDLWNQAEDALTSFDKLHFWSSQACFLQLISASGSQTISVAAGDPYTRSSAVVSASYAATPITAAPTTEQITRVHVFNPNASALRYRLILLD